MSQETDGSLIQKYEQAERLYAQGQYEAALSLYTQVYDARTQAVDRVKLLSSIGACYGWLGDFAKSHEFDRKRFEENDDPVSARYYEALYLYDKGDHATSLRILDELLIKHPDRFDQGNLELWRGMNLTCLEEYRFAVAALRKSYQVFDRDKNPTYFAILLYELGYAVSCLDEDDEALAIYEECREYAEHLMPGYSITWHYLLARLLREAGRFKEAVSDARAALDLASHTNGYSDEDLNVYRLELARSLVGLAEFEAAIAALSDFVLSLADEWETFLYQECISKCYFELKQYEQAVTRLREFLALDKTKKVEPRTIYEYTKMLAISLAETGEKEQALELCERLANDPLASLEDKQLYAGYMK
jgi:tetratricopeptide (TPR) repeat protein